MPAAKLSSQFLEYLASNGNDKSESFRLPSLHDLSARLGISVSSLREQMEVARALGLVEVRPRTGIRRLPYNFTPAVRQSLSYAVVLDRQYFEAYSDLRHHVEAVYWHEATRQLTAGDLAELHGLIASAWDKLRGSPIQIPHEEHRQLHLSIYSRLDNPFVLGILEAYWDAYEAVGLNVYAGYSYLQEVWSYHQRMVEAISAGDYEEGYRALVEHNKLINQRPVL